MNDKRAETNLPLSHHENLYLSSLLWAKSHNMMWSAELGKNKAIFDSRNHSKCFIVFISPLLSWSTYGLTYIINVIKKGDEVTLGREKLLPLFGVALAWGHFGQFEVMQVEASEWKISQAYNLIIVVYCTFFFCTALITPSAPSIVSPTLRHKTQSTTPETSENMRFLVKSILC